MAEEPSRLSIFADSRERDDFGADRIRWLITLRWVAMAGVLAATGLVLAGYFPGVAWRVLLLVVAVGSVYNYFLLRRASGLGTGKRAAVSQALVDLVLLTVVLWAAGGISSPFIGFYVFHLALIGILGGPGATLVATAAALAAAGFLALTEWVPWLQIGVWDPAPPWDTVGNVAAFTTTVAAVAYVVLHAVRELRDREQALATARDQAELEYQVISNTLDELEAGLEVVSAGAPSRAAVVRPSPLVCVPSGVPETTVSKVDAGSRSATDATKCCPFRWLRAATSRRAS